MDRNLDVFISSAIGEFANERKALKAALEGLRLVYAWVFELETAYSEPRDYGYLRHAAEADIFVLIIGDQEREPVEREFATALGAHRPILAFVKRSAKEKADALFAKYRADDQFKYAIFDDSLQLQAQVVEAVRDEITIGYRKWPAQARQLVQVLPRLPQTERDELDRAYLADVARKYEFWHTHYTPPAAITRLRDIVQTRRRLVSTTATPAEFLPRGFDVLMREKFPGKREMDERRERREAEKTEHYYDLRDAVEKHGDLILLGDPGSGKTTTLWRLMFDYATCAQSPNRPIAQLPILISLGRYDGTSPILDFLRAELVLQSKADSAGNAYLAHRQLAAHLDEYLDDGRVMLLFDALNEMPQAHYSDSIRRLEQFHNAQRRNRLIFTCRALDYTTKLDLPEATIRELDEDAQKDFLTAYFADTGARLFETLRDSHKDLLDIGRNPYMLRMIGEIYQRKGELSSNRGLLFRDFVNTLLEREHERETRPDGTHERKPNRWLDADLQIRVLSDLAFAIQREHGRGTSVPRECADKYITGSVRVNGRDVAYNPMDLLYLARSASLLDESADGSFRFTHQLLQEYLAAVYLNSEISVADFAAVLGEGLLDGKWNETILILAGITEHALELVRWIADLAITRQNGRMALLALRCWRITKTERDPIQVPCNVVEALVNCLYDEDWDVKERGFAWLVYFGRDRNNLDVLLNSLKRLVDQEIEVPLNALKRLDLKEFFAEHQRSPYKLVDVIVEIGEPAIESVIPLLHHRDKPGRRSFISSAMGNSIRLFAARILDRIGTPRANQAIGDVLCSRHPDTYLRRDAVRRLRVDDFQTFELLITALSDSDWQVRAYAVWELGSIGEARALPELERLARPSLRWLNLLELGIAQHARWAIKRIHWRHSTVEQLIAGLQIGDSNVRKIIVEQLAQRGDARAVEPLIVALRDRDRSVRKPAVDGLGRIGSARVVEPLKVALHDSDWSVRQHAADALGKVGGTRAADVLLAFLAEPSEKFWIGWGYLPDALARTGDPRAVDLLIAHLHSEDQEVSYGAANLLAQMGAIAIDPLIAILHNSDEKVQGIASNTLAKIGLSAVESLIAVLHDPNAYVRSLAADALGNIGDARAVPELKRLASEFSGTNYWDRPDVVEAQAAINEIRWHQKTIEELLVDLNNSDHEVRKAAVSWLGRIVHPRAEEALIKTLHDPNRDVRIRTFWALEKIGNSKTLEEFARIRRESEDTEMVHHAERATEEIRKRMRETQ